MISELNVKDLVSPTQLAASFERDLQDPAYVEAIAESRAQMIAGETVDWRDLANV